MLLNVDFIFHFNSSVEDEGVSGPPEHSFTLSRSGLPGRDFCEENAFLDCCISSVDLERFFMCFWGEVEVWHSFVFCSMAEVKIFPGRRKSSFRMGHLVLEILDGKTVKLSFLPLSLSCFLSAAPQTFSRVDGTLHPRAMTVCERENTLLCPFIAPPTQHSCTTGDVQTQKHANARCGSHSSVHENCTTMPCRLFSDPHLHQWQFHVIE